MDKDSFLFPAGNLAVSESNVKKFKTNILSFFYEEKTKESYSLYYTAYIHRLKRQKSSP